MQMGGCDRILGSFEFLYKYHRKVLEEYLRFSDELYYEGETIYHPIRSGFSCGESGSNERLVIDSAFRVHGTDDFLLNLKSLDVPNNRYQVRLSDAFKSIAKVNESIKSTGKPVRVAYVAGRGKRKISDETVILKQKLEYENIEG